MDIISYARNFLVFIKHDKSDDPIGLFIPVSWRDTDKYGEKNFRKFELNKSPSIKFIEQPFAFYFHNNEIKQLLWKNEESALLFSNDKHFLSISGGLQINSDRMKADSLYFRNDCWQWP